MLIDKYTKHSIFSLPQIFGNILCRRDLIDSEFVNMYMNDINNPLLSSHIFLVFHNIKPYLLSILKHHYLFHSDYTITINKIKYTVLAFNRAYSVHSVIRKIEYGLYKSIGYETKIKILKFWNAKTDSNLHKYLFDENTKTTKPISENITLQDTKSPNSFNAKGAYYCCL